MWGRGLHGVASVAMLLLALAAASCGSAGSSATEDGDLRVVATTSVLGDLVADVVGDAGTVSVLMDGGQDPHTFQLSARQAAELGEVDLVVANGLGLEAGIAEALDQAAADGVPLLEVGPALDPIPAGPHDDHAEHEGEDHDGADHGGEEEDDADHGGDDQPGASAGSRIEQGATDHDEDDRDERGHGDAVHDDALNDDAARDDTAHEDEGPDDHGHGAFDPHVWLDVNRMSRAPAIVARALDEVADGPWDDNAASLTRRLRALDTEVADTLAAVPADCRRVATDHDVLHYFGDRYDLEVVVTIIPGTSTEAEPSARDLAQALDVVSSTGVPVLVVEDTATTRVADVLADDAGGDLEVLALPLSSLGGPSDVADYPDMMRRVADELADALADC